MVGQGETHMVQVAKSEHTQQVAGPQEMKVLFQQSRGVKIRVLMSYPIL